MGWARLDDGFHDHPKLIGLPLDALGLWTKCFTWAHRHQGSSLVLGYIPEGLPALFAGARGPKLAELLVKHRLWDIEEGLGGWQIHDYSDYLPATERPATADDVRKARSEAGKRGAKARWEKKATAKQVATDLPGKAMAEPDGKTMPPSRPVPTRPVPSRPQEPSVSQSSHVPERESYPQDDDGDSTRRAGYWRGWKIQNPARITALISQYAERPVSEDQAISIVAGLLAKASRKQPVRNVEAYVEGSIAKSWAEIQRDLDAAAVAA